MNTEEMKQDIVRWAKREVELAHREQVIEVEAGTAMLDVEPILAAMHPIVGIVGWPNFARSRSGSGGAAAGAWRRSGPNTWPKSRGSKSAAQISKKNMPPSLRNWRSTGRRSPICCGVEVAIMPAVPGTLSRQQALQVQIGNLRNKVAWLQDAAIPSSGTVDVQKVTSVDPLIDELAMFEGAIPPMQRVLDWAKSCEPVPGETFREMPRSFYLVWADGRSITGRAVSLSKGFACPDRSACTPIARWAST